MTALGKYFRPQRKKRNHLTDSRGKTRARRTLLEQLESRRLLAAAPFNESFNSFDGSGFTAAPTAGQLDSDDWRVTGLSDGPGTFGGTHDSGDFAKGAGPGSVFSGGVYSFDVGAGNNVLGVQPTGSDFTPGEITLKVDNTSGSTISAWDLSYDIAFNNDGDRANSLNLEFSTDDSSYSPVAALDFTTPEVLDALGWQTASQTETITPAVPAGQSLYLRWTSNDVSGGGNRDELGIDNVSVSEAGGTIISIVADDAAKPEGDSGTSPFTFTVTRGGDTSGTSSVQYAVTNGSTNASDFSGSTSGTVSFAATETSKPVTINVQGDTAPESNESFTVDLSSVTGGTIGTASAAGTIQDDDTPLSTAVINEFVYNHAGVDINEFIEVKGAANENLSAYTVIVVDGDGTAAGVVNNLLTLGSANSSGYVLAAGGVLNSAFQNGTQTALLVKDFTGAVGQDLDSDNDGTFDTTPWSIIIDDVAIDDGGAGDVVYTTSAITASTVNDGNTFTPGGASRIPDGGDTDTAADWVRNAFSGEGAPDFPATGIIEPGEALNTPADQFDPFTFGTRTGLNFLPVPLSPALSTIETNGSTDVTESGGQDTFEIALTTNPSSAVTVTVTPDSQLDLGNGAGIAVVLVFNNKLPQLINVAADDDAIVELAIHTGLISISSTSTDSSYNNKTTSVTANIADNDTPAPLTFLNEFVINHTGADINEFIELLSTPNAILSSLTLINIDGDPGAGVGEVLNSDALGTANASGFLAISPAIEYEGGSNIVLVEGFIGNVGTDVDVDDDGIFDWDQTTVPSGGLSAAPWTSIRDAVSVPGAGDESYGFVELSAAAFNDGNTFDVGGASRIPDATTVTTASSEWIRNDFAGQGLADYPFGFGGESEPGDALNTRGGSNSLINGLSVEESGGTTTAAEGGAGDTLTLSLGGEIPTADVTVTITPDAQLDLGAGAGVAITETFTAPSQGPIAVNVDANDDLDVEGPHSGVITFSYSSTDPNYSSGTAPDVSVTIADNEVGGETPQIIINEIMKNPAQVADGDGEYFELYNAGDLTVDLNGWTISDAGTNSHVISGALNIAPGEYLVLGRSGNFATNGGVSVDYVYSDFFLGNGTDEVILSTPSAAVIDEVVYNDIDFPDVNGASLELLPAILANPNPETDNDDGANWQASTTALGTDFGTPGAVNSAGGDTTPPTVTDVIVAGVGGTFAWTPEFIDAVDDGSTGPNNGLGYSVIGTTRTVPWYTVNTIYVQFSEDVNVSGADLFGVNIPDYAGNFTVSTTGSLTTITMTSAFGPAEIDLGPATTGIDKLLLRLQATAVTDLAGNALASEFTQQIDVLPGDGTGNGSVNNQDVGLTNLRGFLTTTDPGPNGFGFSYDPFFDITADGGINNQDVGLTNFQGFDALPVGSPTPTPPPAFAGGGGGGSSANDESSWTESVDQVFGEGLF